MYSHIKSSCRCNEMSIFWSGTWKESILHVCMFIQNSFSKYKRWLFSVERTI